MCVIVYYPLSVRRKRNRYIGFTQQGLIRQVDLKKKKKS